MGVDKYAALCKYMYIFIIVSGLKSTQQVNEVHLSQAAAQRDPPPVQKEAQQHVGDEEQREAQVHARHAGDEDAHRRVEAPL